MTKFSDLKLDPRVLQAVTDAGYETPTPIQAGAIPPALEGRDVLGIAQTGTGKTASFVLPMITLLGRGRARARMPRSLVLAPTRELAAQVAENFDKYAKHTKLTKALLIGGVSFGDQDKLIDRGVDVLIATPGRLLDHFERGKLLLTGVQIMVVDEADRMLDMGFIPDIERIFNLTPFTRQTLFFSATMAPEIERITNTFLHTPASIEVARQATASETIEQRADRHVQPAAQGPDRQGQARTAACDHPGRRRRLHQRDPVLQPQDRSRHPGQVAEDRTASMPHRSTAIWTSRSGRARWTGSATARCGSWWPRTWRRAAWTFRPSAMSSTSTCPAMPRITSTASAARGAPAARASAITIVTPGDQKYLDAIEALIKMPIPRAPLPEGFALSEATHQPAKVYDDKRGPRGRVATATASRGDRGAKPLHDEQAAMQPLMGVEPIEAPAAAPEAPPARSARKPDRREDRAREDRPRPDHVRADRAPRRPPARRQAA